MSVKSVITDADKPFVDSKQMQNIFQVPHVQGALNGRVVFSLHYKLQHIQPLAIKPLQQSCQHQRFTVGFLALVQSRLEDKNSFILIRNVPQVLRSDEELANQLADLDMSATCGLLGVNNHMWSELGVIERLGMSS